MCHSLKIWESWGYSNTYECVNTYMHGYIYKLYEGGA